MKKEKIYAAVYARFSDGPNQTEQSIEGQIRDIDKYAADNGITIVEYYIDRHISGRNFDNRADFQRMLHDSAKKQFSVVLVWKIDRFGRNREEIAINKYKFRKNGISVVSVMEHIPEGPEGILLASLYEGLAEYYSAELSQKVTRGMRESAIKGKVIGTITYGFKKSEDGYHERNTETAPILEEAFIRYYNGETVPDICDNFTARGILKDGKPFTPNFFYRAFRNRKYLGDYEYKGEVYKGVLPQLIPDALFDGVNKLLDQNVTNFRKYKAQVDFLLSGKLICGNCGYNYVGESGTSHTSNVYHYYKCHGKKMHKSKCTGGNFKKNVLEQFILDCTIKDVLCSPVLEIIADSILALEKESDASYTLKSLLAQKKEIDKTKKNLMKAIEAGIITPTTKERLLELESQSEALTIAIKREEMKKDDLTKEHILFWLDKFVHGEIHSESFQKTLIDVFINKIMVFNDKIVIAYNFANNDHSITFEEYNDKVRMYSNQVDLTGIEPVSKNQFTALLRV